MNAIKSGLLKILSNEKVSNVITIVGAVTATVVIYGIAFKMAEIEMDYMMGKVIDVIKAEK